MSTLDDLSDGTRVDNEPLDQPAEGGSRLSKDNCQASGSDALSADFEVQPGDLPGGVGMRPLSVGEASLRNDCTHVLLDGESHKPSDPDEFVREYGGEIYARPTYAVVNEWRDWMQSPIYQSGHLEIESDDGETAYIEPRNRFQEDYSAEYYGRLKTLERGVERIYDSPATIMLSCSSTNLNADDNLRCPADQMREIEGGRRTARKTLYHILEGYEWCHARIWEPHQSGYGHQHIAIFVDDPNDELTADDFEPFMSSYTDNTPGAGTDAHTNEPCDDHAATDSNPWRAVESGCPDCDVPVSVNHDIEDIAGYLSEYLGIYGEEALERPLTEQLFFATLWATETRRLDFGNDAQDIANRQYRREETDSLPDDRGGDGDSDGNSDDDSDDSDGDSDDDRDHDGGTNWHLNHLCTVHGSEEGYRSHQQPGSSEGSRTTTLDSRSSGLDPPKYVE